jgi:hypothetical protein
MMYKHFLFYVELSFFIYASQMAQFIFLILLDYTPLYSFQNGSRKQTIWISFALATYLQTRLQLQSFPHIFCYHF